jgi:molybdate transport system substrate-binding protein
MEHSEEVCLYAPARSRTCDEESEMDHVGRRLLGRGLGLLAALALALGAGAAPTPAHAQGGDLIVFAAASMKNALDAINAQWKKEKGKSAKISYAASSALAKQIEGGAPAQLFISADIPWMDYVAQKDLIKPETRTNLLGNRIVLVAPKDKPTSVDIKPGFDLANIIGDGRLAMANVESVPAGKYGKASLEKLGLWDKVSGKLAQAENVRAALLLVSRGEAPAGIVYATDAASDEGVTVIGTFPENSHPPIIYPVALTKSAGPDAEAFLAYIKSGKARPLFEAEGFAVVGAGPS